MLPASQSDPPGARNASRAAGSDALDGDDIEGQCAELRREVASLHGRIARQHREGEQFLALLSHELFTPLSVIEGFTRLLLTEESGSLSADQRRYLESSSRSCERVNDFVSDLLDVTSGVLDVKLELADLADTIHCVTDSLHPLLEEHQLRIETRLEADLPGLHFDPRRVEQVLTNLLANAIKFTKPASVIDVEVRPIRRAGESWIAIDVIDDGPGICDDDRERIFEPFARAASATRASGIGLGLAICRRIALAHGGAIDVAHEPGRGSRFTFAIPTAEPQGSEEL